MLKDTLNVNLSTTLIVINEVMSDMENVIEFMNNLKALRADIIENKNTIVFGTIIRNLRLSKSLYTRQQFAELLGITPEQLHNIEASKLIPSDDLIIKIAYLLKVNVDYLRLAVHNNCHSSDFLRAIP